MSINRKSSNIDKLSTLYGKQSQIRKAVAEVREAVGPLTNPDTTKILVAIAADIWAGVEERNDLSEVKAASAALAEALNSLEAVTSPLNG